MTSTPEASVAIIMRSRNRSLLLDRAVRDVLKQTVSDWTLVVVNDGGDRHEVDPVIDRYRPELGGRISVIHHEKSLGMEAASNAGTRASNSEFIAIHDDDDEWHPSFLARTLEYLRDNHEDAAVAVRTERVYERIKGDQIEEVGREIFCPDVQAVTLFDTIRHNRCVPISVLYRRSVHESIGDYDESLSVVGDWDFQLRLLLKHTMGFIDGRPLAYWNHRQDATGALGNSVIVNDADHRRFDLEVRERHLKEYAARHGIGALLYQTAYQQKEADRVHERKAYAEELLHELLDHTRELSERVLMLEAAVSDASLVSLMRRRYRRLKARILGR